MKNFLAVPLLCIGLMSQVLVNSVQPSSAMSSPSKAAHHIHFENKTSGDSCSATAVGKHTLLTAAHCIIGTSKIYIDKPDTQVDILSTVYDEQDHVLVGVDYTFDDVLPIDERAPEDKEHVRMFGYPGRSMDQVAREGHFARKQVIDLEGTEADIYVLPVYGGDSGSGIISDAGKIITVVSMGDQSADMAAFELKFTPTQLAAIR